MPRVGCGIGARHRRVSGGAPAWTPAALSPLMWYEMDPANITLGPNVSAVQDLSGNGRHATQPTSGEQPTLTTSAALNNASVIHCNNTGMVLPTYSPTPPYTVVVVSEIVVAPAGFAWFVCHDGAFGAQAGRIGAYNLAFSTPPAVTTGAYAVAYLITTHSTGGAQIRFGGTTYTPDTGGISPIGEYRLGYRLAGGQSMNNRLGFQATFPGILSGANLTSLAGYLATKYGATL